MAKRPTFSILHTSARPDKWREIYDAWLAAAVHSEDVEYVLVVDQRWGFHQEADELDGSKYYGGRPQDKVLVNTGRMCYVDGVNLAAQSSTGQVLIVIADDQYPAQGWDAEILKQLAGMERKQSVWQTDFVLRCSTGTPSERERNITVMPVVSRARYDRLGYIFYPEYTSMFADNDLSEHAQHDGVLIEAPELVFSHRHPFWDKTVAWDTAYAQQNAPESYAVGRDILERRRTAQFGSGLQVVERRKTLAVALPGDHFSGAWVQHYTMLFGHLMGKFKTVLHVFAYNTNVYVTRSSIADWILNLDTKPDYVLWLDDDNLLSAARFDMLLKDLEADTELDGVTAWTYCAMDAYEGDNRVSCGVFEDKTGKLIPLTHTELMEGAEDVKRIGYTGFGAFLMRYETLIKAGRVPFAPFISPAFAWGFSGEDSAFCINAGKRGGCRFAVDRRVMSPHLKLRPVGPVELLAEEHKTESAA